MVIQSKRDIENISQEILKTSKSFDIFPTPVNRIVDHTELFIAGGIDLKSLEKKYKSFFLKSTKIWIVKNSRIFRSP